MRLFRNQLPPKCGHPVYAIGNFDGLHLGHVAVIRRALEVARAKGEKAGVISFEPHPKTHFAALGFARLTPFHLKAQLLDQLGVELFACLKFNKELAGLSGEGFIAEKLSHLLQASHLLVGRNFRFGKGRGGDFALLQAQGEAHGFEVEAIAPIRHDGDVISSSRIRKALAHGDVAQAAGLLGRWWVIEGRVQRGEARGRKLGFPTANLPQAGEVARNGVYAIYASVAGEKKIWHGVANLGIRPTFAGTRQVLEAHLFGEAGNLYGRRLSVWPVAFLRPEQKFDGLEALKQQIAYDKEQAQTLLAQSEIEKTAPLRLA